MNNIKNKIEQAEKELSSLEETRKRIRELDSRLKGLNRQLRRLKVLEEYLYKDLDNWYELDKNGISQHNEKPNRLDEKYNIDYSIYHTEQYAELAYSMKAFNDKLLAYKWCYDREHMVTPKQTEADIIGNTRWYVYYSPTQNRYDVVCLGTVYLNTVYFSSKEIAEGCCAWLNNGSC